MQTAVSKILKIIDRSEQFWRVQWSAVQVSHQDIRGLRGPFHLGYHNKSRQINVDQHPQRVWQGLPSSFFFSPVFRVSLRVFLVNKKFCFI